MRTYDNGSGFTVSYSDDDAANFAAQWPCSTVEGSGSFSFERNGDLIGATGTAEDHDGSDWLAFSQDCQQYGEKKIQRKRISQAKKVV